MVRPLKNSLQFWWLLNGERAGLVIALVGGGALIAAFTVPTAAPTSLTGVVTGFIAQNSDVGTGFNATVYVDAHQVLVPLSSAHRCFAGATIRLRKTHTLLVGDRYHASDLGCAPTLAEGR